MQTRCSARDPRRMPGNSASAQSTSVAPSLGAVSPKIENATRDGGQPLDAPTQRYFEGAFGHRFGDVRVHTGERAETAARAVDAAAFTSGSHIVFGSPGRYAPGSSEGRRLLAHELAHVVQQRHAATVSPGVGRADAPAEVEADAIARQHADGHRAGSSLFAMPLRPVAAVSRIQRQPAFDPAYIGKGGKVRSHLGVEYESYKASLPATEATSLSGGHRLRGALTRDELLAIFDGIASDLGAGKVPAKTVDSYFDKLNQAFRVLRIDTVEAQASYIANAYHESDQFRYLTETQKAVSANVPYETDPAKVRLAIAWLDCAAEVSLARKNKTKASERCERKAGGVIDYETGGTIDPAGDWDRSFIGRGPVQVTHRHAYVQAIAVLERRAEELEQAAPQSQDTRDLREAVTRLKADPRAAADPKITFLFSAAFMKTPDSAKGIRGDVKATQGQVTSWMGKQPQAIEKKKRQHFEKARKVLMHKYDLEQAEANRASKDGGDAAFERLHPRLAPELR